MLSSITSLSSKQQLVIKIHFIQQSLISVSLQSSHTPLVCSSCHFITVDVPIAANIVMVAVMFSGVDGPLTCRCAETRYLFDLVFKVCIIFVVDHLG